MTEEQRYWLEKNFIFELLKRIPTQVFWKNKQGVYLGCNDAFAHSLGLDSPDDVIGKTDFDLPTTEEASEAYRADDKQVMDSKQPKLNIEELQTFIDGRTVVLLTSKVPLLDASGKVVGILGIYSDITERKKEEKELIHAKEQAEAANKLKTEFIQNMQHDIRTPISGIWSLLENASQSENLEEFRDYIPFGVKAAKELLELCNDVIDFENIEYGDKPVYSRKFSLLELAHSAINLNSAAVLAHKSSLELKIDEDVPDVIKGDDYRLKKILINLIGNAVKFTEKGKIKLHIKLIDRQDKKVTIRFLVKDSGIGIPTDKLNTIFEKFTRLNPSNNGKFKGSGLGLYLVKKFVEEIDAELDLKSTFGKGTTFTIDANFSLPIVGKLADDIDDDINSFDRYVLIPPEPKEIIDASTIELKVIKENKSSSKLKEAIRVCLIEDDTLALLAAERRLLDLARPCAVFKAENMTDALHLLKHEHVDLVISDFGLPDGSGFDIAKSIKADVSHINHHTPFVGLTAHSDDAKRELAKEVGFLAVYNKPLLKDHAEKILADYVPDQQYQGIIEAVDLPWMIEMSGGKEEGAIELLTMLIDSFSKEKILFEGAFITNDFKSARELFHKFRGGLGYVRTPEVEKIASVLHDEVKELEKRQGDLKSLSLHLHALFRAVDAVSEWLENRKKHRH
jgi:PAS domain S-box-containing protein